MACGRRIRKLICSRKWTIYCASLVLVLYWKAISMAGSAPISMKPVMTSVDTIKFMRQFGYLEPMAADIEALYSEDAIVDAIRNVQYFGGISQTGRLDEVTINLMKSPRCGVPDMVPSSRRSGRGDRTKRYIVGARTWTKRKITYFIANWSPKVGEQEMAADMKRAFGEWGKYGNLKFVQKFDPSADIIVAFGSGYHGDNYPFDGPGNILAHAFFPYEMGSFGGDVHFDNDENWTRNDSINGEINFLAVAIHELGHSLGLSHSPVYNSIMFPYYKPYSRNLHQLDWDDVLAMYNLYVKPNLEDNDSGYDEESVTDEVATTTKDEDNAVFTTSTPIITTTTTKSPSTSTESIGNNGTTTSYHYHGDYETVDDHRRRFNYPTTSNYLSENETPAVGDGQSGRERAESGESEGEEGGICSGQFDAITAISGELFVFRGRRVWRLGQDLRTKPGYPMPISSLFSGFSGNKIDSAYQRDIDGAVVFFSGNEFWVFKGNSFEENSPKRISDFGIGENVTRIDAAFIWNKNFKTYLFSGDQFWRYDDLFQRMDEDYPKNISRWHGIPKDLDDVATMPSGETIFFKSNSFWVYNNYWIRPELGYPKLISTLFPC